MGRQPTLPLPADDLYRFMGIGDFDGDGRDDVLLRRRATQAWIYYAVQAPDTSPRVALREGFGVTQNPTFELRGVGDLNGDGRDALVLRNTATGEWIAYLMDGTRSELRRGLGATRNLKYVFAGLGDFNGDGRDDLLLRHVSTGEWIHYEMNSARGACAGTLVLRHRFRKGSGFLNELRTHRADLRAQAELDGLNIAVDGLDLALHGVDLRIQVRMHLQESRMKIALRNDVFAEGPAESAPRLRPALAQAVAAARSRQGRMS